MKTIGPIFAALIAAFVLWCPASWTVGGDLVPPDDPTQNISYWKPYVIEAEQDALAAKSHAVFEVLLRAWDSSRWPLRYMS